MSQLLTYSIGSEYLAALEKSLPEGEVLRAVTVGFFCGWENRDVWNRASKQYVPVPFQTVTGQTTFVLTNVSVRFALFKQIQSFTPEQEALKKDLLAKGKSEEKATKMVIKRLGAPPWMPIPEIGSSSSFQIADISSILYREFPPADFIKSCFGNHIAEVGQLSFSCQGQSLDVYSLYSNLAEIFRHLDATKSGAAIASSITSVEASLSRLKALFDEELITGEEFDRAKSALVGKASDLPESAASGLRQLHSLFLSGVLTEAEYKAKKFEVLAKSSI